MSKTTISAVATGLPTRRLFLAAGSAATVFGAITAAARGAEASDLRSLIAKHRVARETFCEAVDIEEEADQTGVGIDAAQALWQETNDAEKAAAIAVLSYPCQAIEEARIKAEYVLSSPLKDEIDDPELLMALLHSFVGNDATARRVSKLEDA